MNALVQLHSHFYNAARTLVATTGGPFPSWLTANLISYLRTTCIVPTLLLLSTGWQLLPALFVLANAVGLLCSEAVAQYWVQKRSPDAVCFVLDTDSQTVKRRKREFSSYLTAMSTPTFLVPLWIFLLSQLQGSMLSMLVLWPLIFASVSSGFARTVAYHTAVGDSKPWVSR